MMMPLKRSIFIVAIAMTAIMSGALLLGVRQVQLQQQHEIINIQSEKILFQFATVREQIIEMLLHNQHEQLKKVADDLDAMRASFSQLLANEAIPEEYKFSILNQVDLQGIVLLLRQLAGEELQPAKLDQLNTEMRKLAEKLMLFDRMMLSYAKSRLIGYQNFVIGALALTISIVFIVLFKGHKAVLTPLIELARQVREVSFGKRDRVKLLQPRVSMEIADLEGAFQNFIANRAAFLVQDAHYDKILFSLKRIGKSFRTATGKTELLAEVATSLLLNDDYCYVMIWAADPESNDLIPVLAEGITETEDSMKKQCAGVLMAEAKANGQHVEPHVKAFKECEPVVAMNILAGMPKGRIAQTALADAVINCAALPLHYENEIYGVLTIYSRFENSFDKAEMNLLEKLADDLSFVLHTYEIRADLDTARQTTVAGQESFKLLSETFPGLVLCVSNSGEITFASKSARQELMIGDKAMVAGGFDKTIASLLDDSDIADIKRAFLDKQPYSESKYIQTLNKEYNIHLTPCQAFDGHTDFLLTFMETRLSNETDNELYAVKAVIFEEIAAGMANEINNLCNGVINYAQYIVDEMRDRNIIFENGHILNDIISDSESIARMAGNLQKYGGRGRNHKEVVDLLDLVKDSINFVKHQIIHEGIQIGLTCAENLPQLPLYVQDIQYVLLCLIRNARKSLQTMAVNKKNAGKIDFVLESVSKNGRKNIRMQCIDNGAGGDFLQDDVAFSDSRTKKILSAMQYIITTKHHGSMSIQNRDQHRVQVDLPIAL